jgi:hypothetical protein
MQFLTEVARAPHTPSFLAVVYHAHHCDQSPTADNLVELLIALGQYAASREYNPWGPEILWCRAEGEPDVLGQAAAACGHLDGPDVYRYLTAMAAVTGQLMTAVGLNITDLMQLAVETLQARYPDAYAEPPPATPKAPTGGARYGSGQLARAGDLVDHPERGSFRVEATEAPRGCWSSGRVKEIDGYWVPCTYVTLVRRADA